MTAAEQEVVKTRLVHHGAAATSSSKVLTWLPSPSFDHKNCSENDVEDGGWGRLVYASHAMINLAKHTSVHHNGIEEPLWNVQETLRTSESYSTSPTMKQPTITALTALRQLNCTWSSSNIPALACGFSNGTLIVWNELTDLNWQEQILVNGMKSGEENKETGTSQPRSITDLTGIVWQSTVLIVSCSSAGVLAHAYRWLDENEKEIKQREQFLVSHHTASTVQLQALSDNTLLILVGTAAPRHNKILIYTMTYADTTTAHYCGALAGHEDWITCFAWQSLSSLKHNYMLASGSQDFRIRLWKFSTIPIQDKIVDNEDNDIDAIASNDDENSVMSEKEDEEEGDYEERESRMDITWRVDDTKKASLLQTSISLEALLLGHEEPVTAVHWYPKKETELDNNQFLLSSSMDRSILIWSPSEDDGIWTPMTRVGSAGGILGGSIGSTLLGYVNFHIMPHCLIGHAYGGALHVWHRAGESLESWKATPCVTGHFNGVTDLCWESTFGDYLLTVSSDQTCRLWAQVDKCWVEVARPQVHGYDLEAVTSLSSHRHRHWIVSGADEKELRIFDAPMTTLRTLQSITSHGNFNEQSDKENGGRVERAYIPSLGLSNKASAADGADEDVNEDEHVDEAMQKVQNLPLERDLGAMSLWLEKRKLFGHNTELYCVTSTVEAKTSESYMNKGEMGEMDRTLVASAAKARDVEAAAIRIWDPLQSACLQTLSGGHKATVVTLSFSSDNGRYLASSGKDRRLCIWKQTGKSDQLYSLAAARDSAHKRIIWSVHFCPFDPSILSSGSRDGNIKIWKLTDEDDGVTAGINPIFSFAPSTLNQSQKPDSVTSLAFAPRLSRGSSKALLAVGVECGLIELWSIPIPTTETSSEQTPQLLQCLPPNMCHVATVSQLAWRPLGMDPKKQTLSLASASMDHGCRIFEVEA